MTEQRSGFTLFELIVVIAIVAILSAVIFPTMASAKIAAKRSVSLSNIKQIGVALDLYSQDNDGYFPHAVDYKSALTFIENTPGTSCKKLRTTLTYDIALNDYVRSRDVFYSPFHEPPRLGKYGVSKASYVLNCNFPYYRVRVPALADPAGTSLATDRGEPFPGPAPSRPTLCLMADMHATTMPLSMCTGRFDRDPLFN